MQCTYLCTYRHTKEVANKTLVHPKLEYAAPVWHPYHETQIGQVKKVQRTAARWTCRRWRNTSSVGEMLDELESSLETRREQSSLTFFYKIAGLPQFFVKKPKIYENVKSESAAANVQTSRTPRASTIMKFPKILRFKT